MRFYTNWTLSTTHSHQRHNDTKMLKFTKNMVRSYLKVCSEFYWGTSVLVLHGTSCELSAVCDVQLQLRARKQGGEVSGQANIKQCSTYLCSRCGRLTIRSWGSVVPMLLMIVITMSLLHTENSSRVHPSHCVVPIPWFVWVIYVIDFVSRCVYDLN